MFELCLEIGYFCFKKLMLTFQTGILLPLVIDHFLKFCHLVKT